LLDSLTTQPDSLDKARELMKIAKDYEIAYKKRLREESDDERSAVRQAAQQLRDARIEAKRVKTEKIKQALSTPMVPKSDDYMENFGLDEKRIRA
jgi:hypothetical protein